MYLRNPVHSSGANVKELLWCGVISEVGSIDQVFFAGIPGKRSFDNFQLVVQALNLWASYVAARRVSLFDLDYKFPCVNNRFKKSC
jgi:hypothetical protein